MAYIVWPLIGVLVSILFGAAAARQSHRSNAAASSLAGAFGALIGGIIGDGVPAAIEGALTPVSIGGAFLGAALFVWAIRQRPPDEQDSHSLRGEPPRPDE